LVLSISDSVYEMKILLEDIKSNFKSVETNEVELKKNFENYDNEILSKLSCSLMWSINGTFFYCRIGNNWKIEKNYVFGEICATGSGESWFMDELKKIPTSYDNLDSFHLNTFHKTTLVNRGRVLNLLGKFIANERFFGTTIKDFWGGGFEIITNQDGVFRKIDDIT
jgi:hypothetical protein